jgi:hypothetical protein
MRQEDIEISVDHLLDREKIRHNLARYSRAVDRQDVDMLASTYWPEAWDAHGMMEGTGHEFSQAMLPIWPTMKMAHLLGQSYIELNGNFANAETYVLAYHRLGEAGATSDAFIGARYNDRLEKRGAIWKFIYRASIFDWYRGIGESAPWDNSIFALQDMPKQNYGATDTDFSWELFANRALGPMS